MTIFKRIFISKLVPLVFLNIALSGQAQQQGDIGKGVEIFAIHCIECHSVKEGKNKKGPTLFGIYGKKVALNATFNYSDAMKNSIIIWNAESLDKYVKNPKRFMPGGKMKYDGLESAEDRANLIALIAYVSKFKL
jgi:cytochrome c